MNKLFKVATYHPSEDYLFNREASIFSALTKVLVATGFNNLVEIIDLTDPLLVCENLADFPIELSHGGKFFIISRDNAMILKFSHFCSLAFTFYTLVGEQIFFHIKCTSYQLCFDKLVHKSTFFSQWALLVLMMSH